MEGFGYVVKYPGFPIRSGMTTRHHTVILSLTGDPGVCDDTLDSRSSRE